MRAKEYLIQKGFTIVELLIVIVVIGILAAITVVAFNGVQTRAENTKTVTAIGQYAKAIQSYAIKNGSYPTPGVIPCLGSAGTVCANTVDGTAACNGSTTTVGYQAFVDAIKTEVSTLPELSSQKMDCGGKLYSGGFYYSPDGKTASIYYYLKGITDCNVPGGLKLSATPFQNSNTTQCTTALPGL